jgi:hypothetical protein
MQNPKRLFLFSLVLFFSFTSEAQVLVRNLGPAFQDYKFPEVFSVAKSQVAQNINTILQVSELMHPPGKYKKHPFEKVMRDTANCCAMVSYYDWERPGRFSNILSLKLTGEATGAYSEGFENFYHFDLQTGQPIGLRDMFTKEGWQKIAQKANQRVKKQLQDFLKEINKDLQKKNLKDDEKEMLEDQKSMYDNCLSYNKFDGETEYRSFYFTRDSFYVIAGRCSNHAMRAIDDLDEFVIGFKQTEIASGFTEYGKNILSGKLISSPPLNLSNKLFSGLINNKYPVSFYLQRIYSDGSAAATYWYEKQKMLIEMSGSVKRSRIQFTEYDDEKKSDRRVERGFFDLVWDGGFKLTGTWTDRRTGNKLPVSLTLN